MQALEDFFRLERALLAHPGGVTLAKMHELTTMPKATLRRYLTTMQQWQRVEQTDEGLWRPTMDWHLLHMRSTIGRFTEET